MNWIEPQKSNSACTAISFDGPKGNVFNCRNKKMLQSLGLDKPQFEPKEKPRPKKKKEENPRAQKRKADEEADARQPQKAPRLNDEKNIAATDADAPGPRRSSRNSGKVVDYKAERSTGNPIPLSWKNRSGEVGADEPDRPPNRNERVKRSGPDPYVLLLYVASFI
jgi:hypothetical protein